MKKLVLVGVVVAVGIFSLWYYTKRPLVTTVAVGNSTFTVDVAVTAREKEIGLGNRDSLASGQGMLFVYDHKERYPFWMRGMRFPIDILWIDDKTIVDISKNVPVSDKPVKDLPLYHPVVPADKVLEINAGLSDKFGITVGNTIKIKN